MPRNSKVEREYISRINRSIDFIEANFNRQFSLEELASAANFSKYHFNRIFSAYVGETPFNFTLRIRLERAASMLVMNSTESTTSIAIKCGFTDLSIFSRNFKNILENLQLTIATKN